MTTPSQTVGPYLAIGLHGFDAVPPDAPGRIRLFGKVYDGEGAIVPDAMIETWQANAEGGFGGRSLTNDDGEWEVFTVKPRPLGDGQARHIDVSVFARGMLNRCVTRIYFADEDNAGDPVLQSVPEQRRHTLIAEPAGDGYRFDVHLQGDGETVFFKL